jgi:hypothetical protein
MRSSQGGRLVKRAPAAGHQTRAGKPGPPDKELSGDRTLPAHGRAAHIAIPDNSPRGKNPGGAGFPACAKNTLHLGIIKIKRLLP